MSAPPESNRVRLCQHLQIDSDFLEQCLQSSVIEIQELDGRLDMGNGSALRLRQIERICSTLEVKFPVALLLLNLTNRIAELETEVQYLSDPGPDLKMIGE